MAPISKSGTAGSMDLNTVRILSVFLAECQTLSSRPAWGSLHGREPHRESPSFIY